MSCESVSMKYHPGWNQIKKIFSLAAWDDWVQFSHGFSQDRKLAKGLVTCAGASWRMRKKRNVQRHRGSIMGDHQPWKPFTGWWFGTSILFSHILGISSSQLTFIFFRGVAQPPTRWYLMIFWASGGTNLLYDPGCRIWTCSTILQHTATSISPWSFRDLANLFLSRIFNPIHG